MGSFVVDTVAPNITDMILNKNDARYSYHEEHNRIELLFSNADEDLSQIGVSLAGVTFDAATEANPCEANTERHTHCYFLQLDPELHASIFDTGDVLNTQVVLLGSDAAGNELRVLVNVILDAKPPLLVSAQLTPINAKNGDTVSLVTTFNEALHQEDSPQLVQWSPADLLLGRPTMDAANPTVAQWNYVVDNQFVNDGSYTFELSATDSVGNEGQSQPFDDFIEQDFVIDTQAPSFEIELRNQVDGAVRENNRYGGDLMMVLVHIDADPEGREAHVLLPERTPMTCPGTPITMRRPNQKGPRYCAASN